MSTSGVFSEPPETLPSFDDCVFYHTMDIPGHGTVTGQWDLRETVSAYLGDVDFNSKRVLDVGTASGFAAFHMESLGADVVGFDLSEAQSWDIVPYAGTNREERRTAQQIGKINNAFWFAHHAYGSKCRKVHGSIYDVPSDVGIFDVAVFGSILLHLRDPFLALESALRLTRETVIIAEALPPRQPRWLQSLLHRDRGEPSIIFQPDATAGKPWETWWMLSPEFIRRAIGVLGFETSQTTYHRQIFQWADPKRRDQVQFYTVVGHRTKGSPST